MRKVLSAILAISLICSLFSGAIAFADGTSLSDAVAAAERELYGMYTNASATYMRDCYYKAIADGAGETEAAALTSAISGLVPLENYTRRELIGFDDITLSGEGTLRYSNASNDGISGNSPFGIATEDCDGFVLKINSDSDAMLDLEIGRRGSSDDCIFVIGDIVVSAGERCYLFPFDRFGDIPLDGTLNYISLSFTGTASVTFGDLHAALGTAENAKAASYSEAPLAGLSFDSEKYYKILQKDTELALTLFKDSKGESQLIYEAADPDDVGQLWQICTDPNNASRFRIINKLTGDALQPSVVSDTEAALTVPSPANERQKWTFSYSKKNGFSIYVQSTCRLAYSNEKVLLKSIGTAAKYFDIRVVAGESWNQVWSDEFNGETVDRSVWTVMDAKNRGEYEPMYNRDSPNNLYTENGNLVIKSIVEEYKGYHATSAYLDTSGKLDFGYGRFEMSAKMPYGDKIWPAFWMMGDDTYWARCGEIDILEMVGGSGEKEKNNNRIIGTMHYYDESGNHLEEGGLSRGCPFDTETLSSDYHIYAVEWDAEQIRWYYDDMLYLTVNIDTDEKRVAFQENPMYLILDTSIEGPGNNQLPEGLPSESYFYIDYIRYYRENNSSAPSDSVPYRYEDDTPDLYKTIWSPSNNASYSMANDYFYYSNYSAKSYTFDIKALKQTGSYSVNGGGWTMSSAISGDGSTVIEGRQISALRVSTADKSVMYADEIYAEYPTLALNNNGSLCYIGGEACRNDAVEYCKKLHIFRTDNMTEVSSEYTGSWVDSITVASNDNYAFGCYDGTVRVRSPQNEDLGNFKLQSRVISLAFSGDCKILFAVDSLGNIVKFDLDTKTATPFASINDEVYKLKVSPDGMLLLAACGDSCARAYSTESGRLVYRVGLGFAIVYELEFSLDGKLLVVSGSSGQVGVYRADDGLPLVKLTNKDCPSCFCKTVTFSSDSSTVMALVSGIGNYHSAVVGWKLPADILEETADSSALKNLPYYDETEYTSKSYAPYAKALKNASALRADRYASQSDIAAAAKAVSDAASALVEKTGTTKGDFDGDGQITVTDALSALRIAAKLAEETPESLAIGDIDSDGSITVTDALAILRVAAKLTATL